jgi:hypothetical protein
MAARFGQWQLLGIMALAVAPAACDNSAPLPAATSPATSAPAQTGFAMGKLTEQSGVPITAKDAKLTVSLWGISDKSGGRISYTPQVNADGTYEQKIDDGMYTYDGAKIDVPFNGKHFIFDLEPVGDDHLDRDSRKGIVQNYVWKLHGVRPGRDADEKLFTSWHGASITMQFQGYREDIRKPVAKGPAGSKCVFTLTPQGPLIDGHEGKEMTFSRAYDTNGLDNPNLPDIPVGTYSIKGVEMEPDGTKKTLLMQEQYGKYAESKTVEFMPQSSTGVWPANVNFTRQD